MTPSILLASLALFAVDATAGASTPPSAPPAAAGAKAGDTADLDKVICKKQEVTGSRFEKRICMTRAEWGEQERRTADFERRLNENINAKQSNPMGGN